MDTNKAVNDAIRFLSKLQSGDGAWRDFRLDVGESTSWVTAYVLLTLGSLKYKDKNLSIAIQKAIDFLLSAKRKNGGWGYNEIVSDDCDSTALAILALTSNHIQVPADCYERLICFEVKPGLFKTFNDKSDSHSWSQIHHEVSAVTNIALEDPARFTSFLDFLSDETLKFGTCPSFWWRTHHYSNFVCSWALQYGKFKHPKELLIINWIRDTLSYRGPFEAALSGLAAIYIGDNDAKMHVLSYLISSQKPDGSWKARPILKYVEPDSTEQWVKKRISTGPLYADVKRIFTTATVLRFLELSSV